VRRVQLGDDLRDARLNAGLTQTEVVKRLGWSQSKLQKIESAQTRTITSGDLDALLGIYGITGEEAEELHRLAETQPSERGSWSTAGSAASTPRWFRRFARLEPRARSIRTVQTEVPPGLLQTETYMRRQFDLAGKPNVDNLVRTRLERQRAVFDTDEGPDCTFIMSESCLRRTLGSVEMGLVQAEHLLELSDHPRVTIRVVPFDAQVSVTFAFMIVQFDQVVSSDFVYFEHVSGATYADRVTDFRAYHERWQITQSAALDEDDSRGFIRKVADEFRGGLP
jgi:transcriptional regulator with XRE-family HTH domain